MPSLWRDLFFLTHATTVGAITSIALAAIDTALDIGWLEEPLSADDIEGHVRLSTHTSVPIAIGESLHSILHFREYLQRSACSIVQVDAGRIGGITPWLKVAHLAETFNIAVCPHDMMEPNQWWATMESVFHLD